jgi:hypothetical protein|tara:strand:+ start:200 stop:550 length:351 start_codon:yes stop_codon:yes gene_type:complete
MVSPINFTNQPENFNSQTEFDNGTAIGMPPINFSSRKLSPVTNLNNTNSYTPDYNPVKRYSSKLSPSGLLTEAFLKARIFFNPVFMHNEAATKYDMISKISTSSSDIKNNEMRLVA